MNHIFLLEDDMTIAKNLERLLKQEGYLVTHASTQKEALEQIEANHFDLALLDVSLPDGNGFSVCTQIKQTKDIPVIFLTAFADEASVVTGLNMGADDYIAKPFRPRELIARIQASLRKKEKNNSIVQIDDIFVDMSGGIVRKSGKEVFLSALEYRLFLVFLSNPNQIITRSRLLDELWDAAGEFVNDNTLTVYIKRLREKIEEEPTNPKIIITVRGVGYRLGGAHVSKS